MFGKGGCRRSGQNAITKASVWRSMYALIINPISGNGRGKRELPRVEALLRRESVPYHTFVAESAVEARTYARQAVEENMAGVIAVGGDGTLFEVINGLAGSELTLLFACCGTGNDFIKTLRLPKDPVEALRAQLHAPISRIDIGRMNEVYFLNVSGTGFDVDVLRHAETYKQTHKGLGVYLRGVRDAIRSFRPLEARVGFDGAEARPRRFTIISIGNGQYIGGGMRAVPTARVNDGFFDVVITRPIPRWAIGILMAIYVPGWYAHTPFVQRLRCKSLRLICPGMTVNLDGELIDCDDADFELLASALPVRIPGLPPRS